MLRINTYRQAQRLGIKIPGVKSKKPHKPIFTKAEWGIVKLPGCIKITIPFNMPSLNVWKDWHWSKQNKFKKQLTKDLKIQRYRLGGLTSIFEKATILVVHCFRVHREHDDDNAAPKFLGDALKGAGFIIEDNSKVLEYLRPQFKFDKTHWKTEVFIYPGGNQK